jgi:hypothetical protein
LVTEPDLESALHAVLKPLGFRKRARTWRLERPEVISVVNLQKSSWGDDFYLNLGVFLKGDGAVRQPAEKDCHIRWRPTIGHAGVLPKSLSDLELVLNHFGLPLLNRLSDRRSVAAFLDSDEAAGFMVLRTAKEWASRK